MTDFATRLQEARGETYMADVAAASGLTVSELGDLENGTVEPGLGALCELAKALQVSVGWLAAGESQEQWREGYRSGWNSYLDSVHRLLDRIAPKQAGVSPAP